MPSRVFGSGLSETVTKMIMSVSTFVTGPSSTSDRCGRWATVLAE